jgi:hypothetical protein
MFDSQHHYWLFYFSIYLFIKSKTFLLDVENPAPKAKRSVIAELFHQGNSIHIEFLASIQSPEAGEFLKVNPKETHNQIPDTSFILYCRRRLYLPIFARNPVCEDCASADVDVLGEHATKCTQDTTTRRGETSGIPRAQVHGRALTLENHYGDPIERRCRISTVDVVNPPCGHSAAERAH